ncbi:Rv3235 family protein [Streptomyces chartreusis]|uniref:Rv3235 family protein n=1 Tax=Streptomyces chartreusis TaxID=1969 RepID=UPI003723717D
MTRTQHRPGTRPPTCRDTRRPADSPPHTPADSPPHTPADSPPRTPSGSPPRTPSGGTPRTTSPGDRPPGSPGSRGSRTRTGPTDTRPRTAPTPTPRVPAPRARRLPVRPDTRVPTPPASHAPTPHAARLPATDGLRASRGLPAAGGLPATDTSPPRPVVPQPRPTDVFADRLLLVLSGQRPVHSMLRHTAGRAYDELAWLAERGPLRTRGTRPVVRDIGYFEPRAGAIEAFARIAAGDQLRAMAFRLEQGNDLRWRCTAVELGGPRRPRANDD